MARQPTPTWCFALVVVRRADRFLLVHERKHGGGWYLPAGRVEPGERFVDAAHRETLEESGLAIELTGVLRVEHTPTPTGARLRVVFVARPARPSDEPRATPNEHTLGARFVSLQELPELPLRGREIEEMLTAVAAGAHVTPLSGLVTEAAPWLPRRASVGSAPALSGDAVHCVECGARTPLRDPSSFALLPPCRACGAAPVDLTVVLNEAGYLNDTHPFCPRCGHTRFTGHCARCGDGPA